MLSQDAVKRILPSCPETRKTRECVREKWRNTSEEEAYQKILRHTNKAPLASRARLRLDRALHSLPASMSSWHVLG